VPLADVVDGDVGAAQVGHAADSDSLAAGEQPNVRGDRHVGVDQAAAPVDEQSAREVAKTASPSGDDADTQQAYQAAFAHVQAREFGEAIAAFEAFVGQHPDSRLAANAYYWLGELHSAESNLEEAETAFQRVLEDFPESSKVPDALYKLGLLEARRGRPEESRALLERVREEHPDSSAAGLADDFLRQAGN
jgi:tol-pal system protein YbgF